MTLFERPPGTPACQRPGRHAPSSCSDSQPTSHCAGDIICVSRCLLSDHFLMTLGFCAGDFFCKEGKVESGCKNSGVCSSSNLTLSHLHHTTTPTEPLLCHGKIQMMISGHCSDVLNFALLNGSSHTRRKTHSMSQCQRQHLSSVIRMWATHLPGQCL